MMPKTLLFLTLIVLLHFNASAQISLQFSVTQAPLLIADAGKDSTVISGGKIRLGGPVVATGGSGLYRYLWSPTSGLDSPMLARPLATIDTTITYTLEVDDGNSCKRLDEIKILANKITAIPNVGNEFGLYISPNPNSGTFYIISRQQVPDRSIQLQITDMLGRVVYQSELTGNRRLNEMIDFTPHAKGIYVLQLQSAKLHLVHKIAIQ